MSFSRTGLSYLCSPGCKQCYVTLVCFPGLPRSRPWDEGLLVWEVIPGSPSREVKRGGKEASWRCVAQQVAAGGGWYSVLLKGSGRWWRTWGGRGGWDINPPTPIHHWLSCFHLSSVLMLWAAGALVRCYSQGVPWLWVQGHVVGALSTSAPCSLPAAYSKYFSPPEWLGGRSHVVLIQKPEKERDWVLDTTVGMIQTLMKAAVEGSE